MGYRKMIVVALRPLPTRITLPCARTDKRGNLVPISHKGPTLASKLLDCCARSGDEMQSLIDEAINLPKGQFRLLLCQVASNQQLRRDVIAARKLLAA
ncbi:MAG: hypothetical protein WC890_02790 [Candidatus Margulisiibacteriota bacterium]